MIQTIHIEIFSILTLIGAIVLFVRYNLSIARELHQARRETSRFPLFAARGQLVRLVAEGRIAEHDPAWRNLYAQVNFVLRMDQQLHLLDLVSRYIQSQLEAERNPKLQEEIAHKLKLEHEARARVPELGRLIQETHLALLFMIHLRTTRLHKAGLLMLSVFLRIVWAGLSDGVSSARVVQRAVAHPSSDSLLRWQAVDGDYRTA